MPPRKPRTPDAASNSRPRSSLKAKWRPRLSYPMVVQDPTGPLEALRAAQQQARLARVSPDDESATLAAVDAAQAAVDACWEPVVLYPLRGVTLPELAKAHAPTEEQAAEGAEWNADTFHPALIASCAQDLAMTAQQWTDELASERWSTAERNELFGLALQVNLSSPGNRGLGAA